MKLSYKMRKARLTFHASLLISWLNTTVAKALTKMRPMHFAPEGPTVILFVGVNGVGKTTTIGKMSARYKAEGKQVVLAAADTFRAGATQQLQAWGERNGIPVVAGAANADPASVVYDGVKTAIETNADILFVDTAGRLQSHLMQELAKMKRAITREPFKPAGSVVGFGCNYWSERAPTSTSV